MIAMALDGSVGAAKLLLDKTVSNAKTEEDKHEEAGGVTIRIENMTVDQGPRPTVHVIDVTPQHEETQ